MPAQRHRSGTPWEPYVGYCRALRVGDAIYVSGTVGVDDEGRPAGGVHEQAVAALRRICDAVEALGGRPSDIVRTRMFALEPQRDWDAIARAHASVFADHPPVSSLIGTSELAIRGCVIEIEAEAVVGAGG